MNSILKLGLNLFVICAVAAGLLAGTNQITAPLIEQRNEQANNEARQAVLADATEFKILDSKNYKSSSKRIWWGNRTYGRYNKRWNYSRC